MSTVGKRIIVTGGSGKAGRHMIPHLISRGHKVLNLDLTPFPNEFDPKQEVYTLRTDLTNSGQVFNAFTANFDMGEYNIKHDTPSGNPGRPDAIIHLAAYARNLLVPDNEMFRTNVESTYNVIEAGCKLGVPKIIIASSETVYGSCFAQGDDLEVAKFDSFPLDEDTYDTNPMDSYACSKLCGEKIARAFSKRFRNQTDVWSFRVGNVIEPHEYARDFPGFIQNPACRLRNAWSYVDARDLGEMCHCAVMKTDYLGFQIFNATNDSITTEEETKDVIEKYHGKDTKFTRQMGPREAPLSNRKIKDVLGFKEMHDWRNYWKNEK